MTQEKSYNKEIVYLLDALKLQCDSVHVLLEEVKEGYETETSHLHVKIWCYFENQVACFVIFSYF